MAPWSTGAEVDPSPASWRNWFWARSCSWREVIPARLRAASPWAASSSACCRTRSWSRAESISRAWSKRLSIPSRTVLRRSNIFCLASRPSADWTGLERLEKWIEGIDLLLLFLGVLSFFEDETSNPGKVKIEVVHAAPPELDQSNEWQHKAEILFGDPMERLDEVS